MRILAVDTSQIQASICVIENKRMRLGRQGSVAIAHSEGLLALIDQTLKELNLKLSDFDLFAAGIGPGSFTGIRIGCATIKTLAQVLNKPVLAFSSLKALAFSFQETLSSTVVAMANAYQGEVFVGWLSAENDFHSWREQAIDAKGWVSQRMAESPSKALNFCGLGAKVYWDDISIQSNLLSMHANLHHLTPEGIARCIQHELDVLKRVPDTYLSLQANYMRPSQAEAKLERVLAN